MIDTAGTVNWRRFIVDRKDRITGFCLRGRRFCQNDKRINFLDSRLRGNDDEGSEKGEWGVAVDFSDNPTGSREGTPTYPLNNNT